MRHLKKHNKLNWKPAHTRAIVINLAKSLIQSHRIRTTKAKAKIVKPFVEKLITKAKNNTLHSKRVVASALRTWDLIPKLFNEIAVKFKDRPGGYTRILKIGFRDSDGSEMVYLEFVEDFKSNKAKVDDVEIVKEKSKEPVKEVAKANVKEKLKEPVKEKAKDKAKDKSKPKAKEKSKEKEKHEDKAKDKNKSKDKTAKTKKK